MDMLTEGLKLGDVIFSTYKYLKIFDCRVFNHGPKKRISDGKL